MNSTIQLKPKQTIVKMMISEQGKDTVFDFLEDVKNMEKGGAISNIVKGPDDWHTFSHIVAGNARVRILRRNREFEILDHLFEGAGLSWMV